MASFFPEETVICSCTVKDGDTLTDPSTSMTIKIIDCKNGVEVDDVDMVKDSTGTYHYDYTLPINCSLGVYTVLYKAKDGTRVTLERDVFSVG